MENKIEQARTKELYTLEHTIAAALLEESAYPWEILPRIGDFIRELGKTLRPEEFDHPQEDVWIARDVRLYPNHYIAGPCISDREAEIRPGAFIRGNAIVGKKAVVGNSTELKNAILFDGVQVPHFNYVGDSVLGWKAHLGAGAVTSNVKSDKLPVVIKGEEAQIPTGRKKVGAMVGDEVEVGCNSVLCPGTVIGKNAMVYPLSRVRGLVPAGHIYKSAGNIVEKR